MTPEQVRADAIEVLANELLTVKEYAHVTRRHPEWIRQLCREGKIRGAMRVGGQWRIRFTASSPCNS